MVLPSLSSDTLGYSKQWTNIDDKTGSSDGFAVCIFRHTQMFKAMDEYDKTESGDGFVIVMLKHTHMFKAFNEYDDKIE